MFNSRSLVLAVLAAIGFCGCLVTSLHPFYVSGDIVHEAVLAGTWVPLKDTAEWTFNARPDHTYELKYVENGSPATFDAVLFSVGGRMFLDMRPGKLPASTVKGSACCNELFFFQLIRGHMLFRATVQGDSVSLAAISGAWIKKQSPKQGKVTIEYVDGDHVLLGTSEALHAFVKKVAASDEAFDKPYLLLRRR
jgi:hypothetical protein